MANVVHFGFNVYNNSISLHVFLHIKRIKVYFDKAARFALAACKKGIHRSQRRYTLKAFQGIHVILCEGIKVYFDKAVSLQKL